MAIPAAVELLNGAAAHLVRAEAPRPGQRIPWADGPLTEIVEVEVPDAHLLTAVDLYGPHVTALQLVHADEHGQWPWEQGWRGVPGGQPVLGVRSMPHV